MFYHEQVSEINLRISKFSCHGDLNAIKHTSVYDFSIFCSITRNHKMLKTGKLFNELISYVLSTLLLALLHHVMERKTWYCIHFLSCTRSNICSSVCPGTLFGVIWQGKSVKNKKILVSIYFCDPPLLDDQELYEPLSGRGRKFAAPLFIHVYVGVIFLGMTLKPNRQLTGCFVRFRSVVIV